MAAVLRTGLSCWTGTTPLPTRLRWSSGGVDGNHQRQLTHPGRGDITYLRTGSGWLYLATVIDLHTRMVVSLGKVKRSKQRLVTQPGRAVR